MNENALFPLNIKLFLLVDTFQNQTSLDDLNK